MFDEGIGNYVYDDGEIKLIHPKIEVMVNSADDLTALALLVAPGSIAYTAGGVDKWQLGLDGTWTRTADLKPLVILTAGSSERAYTGEALTNSSVTAEGLPSGFTVTATTSGTITNVGEADNDITAYTIKASDNSDHNTDFDVRIVKGKLKVTPAAATVTTGSDTKEYDGEALTCATASITGLVNSETATVTATGTQTEVGSSDNTYSIEWGTADPDNYAITESLGTLTVTEAASSDDPEE